MLAYLSELFQSLIGFKINWNLTCFEILNKAVNRFQSLIGFKINWNPRDSHDLIQNPCFNP